MLPLSVAMDNSTKSQVREVIVDHVGKENAIFAGDVAEIAGIDDGDTHVRTREYLTELLREGLPIASNPGHGYWIIKNQEELDNYIGSLERRALKIRSRKDKVFEAAEQWPELDLFDEDL
jgi:hypothetical protein